jgi:hypothetical protein
VAGARQHTPSSDFGNEIIPLLLIIALFFFPVSAKEELHRSWKKHGNVLEASIALISSSTSLTLFLLLLPSVPPHSTRHRFIECRVNHPSQPPPPSECARFQSITIIIYWKIRKSLRPS